MDPAARGAAMGAEVIARALLALQQPATWYAIFAGAGAFGVPLAFLFAWIRSRKPTHDSKRAWLDGYRAGLEDSLTVKERWS